MRSPRTEGLRAGSSPQSTSWRRGSSAESGSTASATAHSRRGRPAARRRASSTCRRFALLIAGGSRRSDSASATRLPDCAGCTHDPHTSARSGTSTTSFGVTRAARAVARRRRDGTGSTSRDCRRRSRTDASSPSGSRFSDSVDSRRDAARFSASQALEGNAHMPRMMIRACEKVLKSATSGTDKPSDANLPRQALARSRSPADVSIRGLLLGRAHRGAEAAAARDTGARPPRCAEPISSVEPALFSIRFRAGIAMVQRHACCDRAARLG